jgi:hypothetical protein
MNYKLETVHAGQEKTIFFLGAQPGDKKFPADQAVLACSPIFSTPGCMTAQIVHDIKTAD